MPRLWAPLFSKWAVLAFVIVGVVVRVGAAAVLSPDRAPLYEFGVIGRNVASGRGYSYFSSHADGVVTVDDQHDGRPLPSAFMPPGYTYLVAGASALASRSVATVRLVQTMNILLAAASIFLVAALAARVFGPTTAGPAALAAALYPTFVYQSTQVSASNLYLPLELGILVALAAAVGRPSRALMAAAAVGLGLLCLLRSEALLLVPLAGLWWYAVANGATGERVRQALGLVLVALVLPVIWLGRNAIVLGRPIATITTSGGFNLWIGNHLGATGSQKAYTRGSAGKAEEARMLAKIDRLRPTDYYELARDRIYLSEARSYVTSHPAATALADARKLAMLITVDAYDDRSKNPLYLAGWGALLVAGTVSAFLVRPERQHRWLLGGYLAFSLLVPTVFFTLARYKAPLEIVLILTSAAGLTQLWVRATDRAAICR